VVKGTNHPSAIVLFGALVSGLNDPDVKGVRSKWVLRLLILASVIKDTRKDHVAIILTSTQQRRSGSAPETLAESGFFFARSLHDSIRFASSSLLLSAQNHINSKPSKPALTI
jgi:hypothetical protein